MSLTESSAKLVLREKKLACAIDKLKAPDTLHKVSHYHKTKTKKPPPRTYKVKGDALPGESQALHVTARGGRGRTTENSASAPPRDKQIRGRAAGVLYRPCRREKVGVFIGASAL